MAAIVAPVYERRRGHPVLFSSAFRDELLRIAPSSGARPVLTANPGAVLEIEVADPGIHTDIDTLDDFRNARLYVDTNP